MIMFCYKSGNSMMPAACYKSSNLIMINLIIIIKIRFIYFKKDEIDRSYVKSNARLYAKSHDYKSCNYGVTNL